MAEFSAQEQLMLELVNRARLDPNAEASRLGITLNQGIAAGSITAAAKQPLAGNALINDAAIFLSRISSRSAMAEASRSVRASIAAGCTSEGNPGS